MYWAWEAGVQERQWSGSKAKFREGKKSEDKLGLTGTCTSPFFASNYDDLQGVKAVAPPIGPNLMQISLVANCKLEPCRQVLKSEVPD